MRSVSVVLPLSMCAEMPMFRSLLRSVYTVPAPNVAVRGTPDCDGFQVRTEGFYGQTVALSERESTKKSVGFFKPVVAWTASFTVRPARPIPLGASVDKDCQPDDRLASLRTPRSASRLAPV